MTTEPVSTALVRVAAADRLLVALDFDGTLAPLRDEPMLVRALPEAVDAVAELAALPETAVAFVSGRSIADLRVIAEHRDDSPIHLAGSHGAELWIAGRGPLAPPDDVDARRHGEALRGRVERAIAGLDGAWVEAKAFGFAVHTRVAAPDAAAEAHAIADRIVAEHAPHWRRRTGHDVVEYSYRHEGKDAAIAALRVRLGATAVLFAGDDVTDEDALASLGPDDLGIRVGSGPTAATVRVADIAGLAAALRALARLRSTHRE